MNKIDMNEFALEVHNNAVQHGFWEGERDDSEVIALIHSELSEALQADRDDEPMLWYKCGYTDAPGWERMPKECQGSECNVYNQADEDPLWDDAAKRCRTCNRKPEGIAVELVDTVIRILDAAAAWKINIKSNAYYYTEDWLRKQSLPWLVSYLHYEMSCVFTSSMYGGKKVQTDKEHVSEHFSRIITAIQVWLAAQSVDFDEVLLAKHEFNTGRPYKHGKKF